MSRIFITCLLLTFLGFTCPSNAGTAELKPFTPGSYQQLLANKTGKPFVLVIWSITCSSCLKDMALLNKLHKANPKLDMVMLTTDDASANEDVQQILAKNELAGLENWIFADDNAQKLRYEIDPKWYGELPRTYFYTKNHDREGISGIISEPDFTAMFKKILN